MRMLTILLNILRSAFRVGSRLLASGVLEPDGYLVIADVERLAVIFGLADHHVFVLHRR